MHTMANPPSIYSQSLLAPEHALLPHWSSLVQATKHAPRLGWQAVSSGQSVFDPQARAQSVPAMQTDPSGQPSPQGLEH